MTAASSHDDGGVRGRRQLLAALEQAFARGDYAQVQLLGGRLPRTSGGQDRALQAAGARVAALGYDAVALRCGLLALLLNGVAWALTVR